MNEQMSMFTDPLRERALKTIRSAIKSADDIDRVFESYYGGSQEGYDFLFDPRTKCFYYADDCFNTYKPEPWVRKITRAEIKRMFIGE